MFAFSALDILDCPLQGRQGFSFLFLSLVSAHLHFLHKQCVHDYFYVKATYNLSDVGNTNVCTLFHHTIGLT